MMTYIYKIKQKVNVTMWTKFWTSHNLFKKAIFSNAFISEKLSRNLIHLHISDDGDKFFFGRKYVRNSWVFLWSPLSLLFPNLINEIFDHISLISILGAIVLKIKWTTKNCHDNSNFFIGTAAGITNNSEKYRAQSFTSLKADLH